MKRITLSLRETIVYTAGWAYCDAWKEVGTAKLTPRRRIEVENGDGGAGSWVQHATIPAGQDREASRQALADTLSYSGCRHEHDCCGCYSQVAIVTPISARRFLVRLHGFYNV